MTSSLYDAHVPRCQHIKTNGTQCGSPALRRKRFCFFHNRWRATRLRLNPAGKPRAAGALELPVLEDADSIQIALMQVMRLLLGRQLDPKIAGLVLYGLQTASGNLGRIDLDHRRKTNIVIDPRRIAENGVGDDAWSPADFAEEDSAEEAEPEAPPLRPASPIAAKRPKNASQGANPGSTPALQAPKGRKIPCPDPADEDFLQSALEGAGQGDWRDLKTVLELAGIFPLPEHAEEPPGGKSPE
jgi:hypothetical protein